MNIYIRIAHLNSPFLHRIEGQYCICPTKDLVREYSQILRLESVESNLSLIIKARRKERRPWNFAEFLTLTHCLVEAVVTLHSAGFSHNDIRPSNVYYSISKKCFILGSFSNVMFSMVPSAIASDIQQSHGKNIYNRRKLSIGEANSSLAFQNDVYALGMTLLSAFYLLEPLNRQKCAPHNRFLLQQYPFLKLIKMMTTSHDKRANIHEVQKALSDYKSIWEDS
jgi:serine/threonine protein kinase